MAAATTFSTTPAETNGIRPINLTTDLGGLADLVELCFGATMDEAGRSAVREMRLMSKSSGLVGMLNGLDRLLGNLQQGFVWIENGRLIGNTTISPAGYPREIGRGSIIANVAVHPDFRQRGIAHRLIEHALALCREKGDTFAVLQVDVSNDNARRIYEQFGFWVERTFTRWQHSPRFQPPLPLPNMPQLWLRPPDEWQAEYELAMLTRPNRRGGMGWLRPTTIQMFHLGWLRGLIYSFIGTAVESYVVYRDDQKRARNGIVGAVRLMTSFGTGDKVDLMVHPFEQGRLEEPLLNYALRRLDSRRRTLTIEHPADDMAAEAVFRKYSFEPRQTLIHMRVDLL